MKLIYLIQSDTGKMPYHIPSSSDVLLLQWQETFQPADHSFHFPHSSWAEGRNELFRRAKAMDSYDYFIFADDDVELYFDLMTFEKLLQKYQPRRAVPWYFHDWNRLCSDTKSHIDLVKYVDHAFMAVRKDCAQELMPYTMQYDEVCWWLSSEDLCERFFEKWPLETFRFNKLVINNLKSREYPQNRHQQLPKNISISFDSQEPAKQICVAYKFKLNRHICIKLGKVVCYLLIKLLPLLSLNIEVFSKNHGK
ncbi:MAG TPA: hypothetical protein DCM38_14575 [Gammaproteobacteria bacterium]|nr:hypothetical protein [Gammaproteobacteria bacterium]